MRANSASTMLVLRAAWEVGAGQGQPQHDEIERSQCQPYAPAQSRHVHRHGLRQQGRVERVLTENPSAAPGGG